MSKLYDNHITKLSQAHIITLVVDLLAFPVSLSSLFYFNSLTAPGCAGQSSLAREVSSNIVWPEYDHSIPGAAIGAGAGELVSPPTLSHRNVRSRQDY